jgi:hypothetical protein
MYLQGVILLAMVVSIFLFPCFSLNLKHECSVYYICSNLLNGWKQIFLKGVFVVFLVSSNFILATTAPSRPLFIFDDRIQISFTSTIVTYIYIFNFR